MWRAFNVPHTTSSGISGTRLAASDQSGGSSCDVATERKRERELIQFGSQTLLLPGTNPEVHCETTKQRSRRGRRKKIHMLSPQGEWVAKNIPPNFSITLCPTATQCRSFQKLKGVQELTQRNRPPSQTGETYSSFSSLAATLLLLLLPPSLLPHPPPLAAFRNGINPSVICDFYLFIFFLPPLSLFILVRHEHPVLSPEGCCCVRAWFTRRWILSGKWNRLCLLSDPLSWDE